MRAEIDQENAAPAFLSADGYPQKEAKYPFSDSTGLLVLMLKVLPPGYKFRVNACDLHRSLQVGRDFSNWIKDRIVQFEFVENEDFEVNAKFGEKPQGGRPAIDYMLTLDMAKELVVKGFKGEEQLAEVALDDVLS